MHSSIAFSISLSLFLLLFSVQSPFRAARHKHEEEKQRNRTRCCLLEVTRISCFLCWMWFFVREALSLSRLGVVVSAPLCVVTHIPSLACVLFDYKCDCRRASHWLYVRSMPRYIRTIQLAVDEGERYYYYYLHVADIKEGEDDEENVLLYLRKQCTERNENSAALKKERKRKVRHYLSQGDVQINKTPQLSGQRSSRLLSRYYYNICEQLVTQAKFQS